MAGLVSVRDFTVVEMPSRRSFFYVAEQAFQSGTASKSGSFKKMARTSANMLAVLSLGLLLSGCDDTQADYAGGVPVILPPWVKTARVELSNVSVLGLSGVVRAQVEVPLSFQVGGRIIARKVDAGQQVLAGELLFELDKRDLQQSVKMATATLQAADLALASAINDLQRHQQLQSRNFISTQALENSRLSVREAQTRRDVALAHLGQMRNALNYGELRAPANGVLMEVAAEVGQVLGVGQTVAVLAQAGARDVEVSFPEQIKPPAQGELLLAQGASIITRREQAGALESIGRTLRVRYSLPSTADTLLLGSVVRTRFSTSAITGRTFSVPLAALNERGSGPCVWRLHEGLVSAVAVTVLTLDSEKAQISGPLNPGDHIVSVGTHLLAERMRVRELNP